MTPAVEPASLRHSKGWVAWQAIRHLGLRWALQRAAYEAKARLGWHERRLRAAAWSDRPLAFFLKEKRLADARTYLEYRRRCPAAFFFKAADRPALAPRLRGYDEGGGSPVAAAERIKGGEFLYFSHGWKRVGVSPDWHRNPFTDMALPPDIPSRQISDSWPGDIKGVWELSRFGFAYTLVRAYWRSAEESYPELFWQLLEDWQEKNPPMRGANWKCGQEAAFRMMAWCWALQGFLDSPATTGERVRRLAQLIAFSGERIEAHLGSALSQRNNHGISEALGLWTIGTMFPELKAASRWERRGRQLLERLNRELIYEDGAFVQHSLNDHRLMLHDCLWCYRLAELNGRPFSEESKARFRRAVDFLYQTQDLETGQVPCYGHNDGALILPLSNCDYRDFCPAVQAAAYLCGRTRRFPSGPWDEDLLWLFGTEALGSAVGAEAQGDLAAPVGGYYALRQGKSRAFVRCGKFRHRPAHADLLHLDLWVDGENLFIDPGTYSYQAPEPWDNPLAHTRYHNTVTVDGLSQMDQVARFLWLPWASGTLRTALHNPEGLGYWEGEHDGYGRLSSPVWHRRAIAMLPNEAFIVLDQLVSQGSHNYRLHWLMGEYPYSWRKDQRVIALKTKAGDYCLTYGTDGAGVRARLIACDPASPEGWRSSCYFSREPALSFSVEAQGSVVLFWSVLSRNRCQAECNSSFLTVKMAEGQGVLEIERTGRQDARALVHRMAWEDSAQRKLELTVWEEALRRE